MNKYDEDIIINAHKRCSNNKEEISKSGVCGCFFCKRSYPSNLVVDWVDFGDIDSVTALCPHCGIDSVLSSLSGYPIEDPTFLKEMHEYWFERTV